MGVDPVVQKEVGPETTILLLSFSRMDSTQKLDGWDIYPENLNYLQACDIHGYNFASYRQQLSRDSERLFLAPNEVISVKVIELGESDENGTSHAFLVLSHHRQG